MSIQRVLPSQKPIPTQQKKSRFEMNRYKYFDLEKFIKASIVTVLLLPVSAVLVAAIKVWVTR
jgi:predicted RNA-binding protein